MRTLLLTICCAVIFAGSPVFSADYTKYAGWRTKPVPIPANPANATEYKCSISNSVSDLNAKLNKLFWSEAEQMARSINFNDNVALLIAKKSFQENSTLQLKQLYTEGNALIAHYTIKAPARVASAHVSFGLRGHRPAIIVQIPRTIYNKSQKLTCRWTTI